jgi:hypothetical protein
MMRPDNNWKFGDASNSEAFSIYLSRIHLTVQSENLSSTVVLFEGSLICHLMKA